MPEKVTIAIVEDEPNIRCLLAYSLQSAGFGTQEYEDGEKACTESVLQRRSLYCLT
jgi:DNA-binding response OmpR family regulator